MGSSPQNAPQHRQMPVVARTALYQSSESPNGHALNIPFAVAYTWTSLRSLTVTGFPLHSDDLVDELEYIIRSCTHTCACIWSRRCAPPAYPGHPLDIQSRSAWWSERHAYLIAWPADATSRDGHTYLNSKNSIIAIRTRMKGFSPNCHQRCECCRSLLIRTSTPRACSR
ncbi:hypothetical protein BD626DRAFT_223871 [Schizophyllum amplum]|uniref:Uncharacterized protein n=1 Tax=Schizophyllum amplum TaxID=97359 RepID=A0A550BXE1_9AGAR|nr:hypothetical protein BD626DRAFT_223871 [Auriculariopsis ampla]